jgi:hypothetical protein
MEKKGHFTQVVWKASRELGVGWATGGNGWTYFCCNYSPTGNFNNDYAGNVLPPGTVSDEPEESKVRFFIPALSIYAKLIQLTNGPLGDF